MTTIKPFRGFHYTNRLLNNACNIIAPPYDVISEKKQEYHYDQSPKNVIRLILGKELSGDNEKNNRYTRANEFLSLWLDDGTLVMDQDESIYGYSQTFSSPSGKLLKRSGFIALMRLEDLKSGNIYAHEMTYENPKSDRLKLTRSTGFQLSIIFSLYKDTKSETKELIKNIMDAPHLSSFTDNLGIEHILTASSDKTLHGKIKEMMGDKKVFIADGHHRYETIMAFRDEMEGKGVITNAHHYAMIYFVPIEDEGVFTLPSHRIVKTPLDFDEVAFRKELGRYFRLEAFSSDDVGISSVISILEKEGKRNFVYYPGGQKSYLVKLSDFDSVLKFFPKDMPEEVKKLDVSILQNVIIEKIMGLKEPEISYTTDSHDAFSIVRETGSLAFLINPTSVDELTEVSFAGERMPHKSTYFYPKVPSGLLFYNLV